LFPGIFTLLVAAFFGPSLVVGVKAGSDPNTRYWLGTGTLSTILLIPVILLVCHILHLIAGRPRFYPSLCSTVIPSIIVLYCGLALFIPSGGKASMLHSTDCTTFGAKLDLDDAYRSAAMIFDTCVQRVAISTNSTAELTAPLIDLQDCSEYQTSTTEIDQYSTQWAYLETLERTEGCSGWCTPGEPALWSRDHYAMDLCSRAAGTIMQGKVKRAGSRLIVLGIFQLLISVFGMNTLNNMMVKRQIDW
jgi:hypothetical protein